MTPSDDEPTEEQEIQALALVRSLAAMRTSAEQHVHCHSLDWHEILDWWDTFVREARAITTLPQE